MKPPIPPEILARYYADYVVLKKYRDLLLSGNNADYDKLLQLGSGVKPSVVLMITDTGVATGFFISSDGCVVTNAHVALGKSTIKVGLIDGTELPATLIKIGEIAGNDLAVLKVKGSNFPALTITTTLPSAGETVLMVGNPFDLGRWVVSSGYYLYNANFTFLNANGTNRTGNEIFVAGIASEGSSGSPMMDLNGKVLGVLFGGASTYYNGITATDSVIVRAENAGYYWVVHDIAVAGLPSSALLKFLEGTPCQPSTFERSTSTTTQSIPQTISFEVLSSNLTKLEQEYKGLASTKFQSQDYSSVLGLASKIKPNVVGITENVTGVGPQVIGTGFLISSDGCVVTNRHVVEHTDRLGVQLLDGSKISATLVKISNATGPDLAILKVSGRTFSALMINPRIPTQGTRVLMVGNPSLFGTWVASEGKFVREGFLRTLSANLTTIDFVIPSASGASGSPLLDLNGTVLGVNFGSNRVIAVHQIDPSDNVVIWAGNAGKYMVNATTGQGVPSEDLLNFLQGTQCHPTVSQSVLGGPVTFVFPLFIRISEYAIAVWLFVLFSMRLSHRIRRV